MGELQEKEAGSMTDDVTGVSAQESTPSSAEEEHDEQTAAEAERAAQELAEQASTEEERAAQELAENNALAAVFDDVRECSAKSTLSTPERWAEIGIVPAHMTAEDFEMYVYDYLEGYLKEHKAQIEREKVEAKKKSQHFHSAKTAVGIPAFMRNKEPEMPSAGAGAEAEARAEAGASAATPEAAAMSDNANATTAADTAPAAEPLFESAAPQRLQHARNTITVSDPENPFYGLEIPAGTKLELVDGEWALVEDTDAEPVKRELDPRHIAVIVGQHSYYLYDEDLMTKQYAQWAFLAAENDPLMTFVNCVREEGRTYPRPLAASDLANPPFSMEAAEIEETWGKVQESGAYPDIVQVRASNGDVYYASTLYLTPEYAESLAEWSSVGRAMNV